MDFQNILAKLNDDNNSVSNKPANESDIIETETKFGISFSETIKSFYLFSDGISAFDGNLNIYQINGNDDFCVKNASDAYRNWKWVIPKEMIIFGDDGCGGPFGFWNNKKESLIVKTGEIFEEKGFTIISDSFENFLNIQISFRGLADGHYSLDEINTILRTSITKIVLSDDIEELYINIRNYFCPKLIKLKGDPYDDRLSSAEINNYI
jgi:hypothetical protein